MLYLSDALTSLSPPHKLHVGTKIHKPGGFSAQENTHDDLCIETSPWLVRVLSLTRTCLSALSTEKSCA